MRGQLPGTPSPVYSGLNVWTGCYPGFDSLTSPKRAFTVGIGLTSTWYSRYGSDDARAIRSVQAIVAAANLIYERQLNIVVQLGAISIQTTTGNVGWDTHGCASYSPAYIYEQMASLKEWARVSSGSSPSDQVGQPLFTPRGLTRLLIAT